MAVGKKAMWVQKRAGTLAFCLLTVLVAVMLSVFLEAKPAHAATFTVTNTSASGAGSLDQRITDANNNDNAPTIDTIRFNIPSSDPNCNATTNVCTISSTSGMPQITEPLTIDGYSQPVASAATSTAAADLKIQLSGIGSGAGTNGLWIRTKNTAVKGLVINRWEVGIRIDGSRSMGNKVTGNYIGTDPSGTFGTGNSLFGVVIEGAPNNTIGGTTAAARNVISENDARGVSISGTAAAGNKVTGNYIGVEKDGVSFAANIYGVYIEDAPNNTIGGMEAGARNIISTNFRGVTIIGAGATGNQVMGNYIGTDVSGTLVRGNQENGVYIEDAPNNTIGGTEAGARNVISGNQDRGVIIYDRFDTPAADATGNKVIGNYIGTDASGTQDLGNSLQGVYIVDAPNNTIGGTTAGVRNVISGNSLVGVDIVGAGATGNRVMGNYIGTDASGTQDLGNTATGVSIFHAPNNTIGGTTAGARNIISGNGTVNLANGVVISGEGVQGDATSNQVVGNYIGTDVSGKLPLGNTAAGVFVLDGASNNTVGGTTAGARNVISGNGFDGITISDASTTGNRILGNSIFSNVGLGIDLIGPGETWFDTNVPTANDGGTADDSDAGPNGLQNKPELTSATTTTIGGVLDTKPNTTYTVQFFSNPSGDEGKKFIGQKQVPTDGDGRVTFSFSPNNALAVGQKITATATGPEGTSEFSTRTVV